MLKSEPRYKGVQTLLEQVGKEGCYVLCLLSIAEEVIGKPIDLIASLQLLIREGCVHDDMYVANAAKALCLLTGKEIKCTTRTKLTTVADNEYTVEQWYNPRTKFIHFKRRGYDTLQHSTTVAEGELQSYRVFTVGG